MLQEHGLRPADCKKRTVCDCMVTCNEFPMKNYLENDFRKIAGFVKKREEIPN